MKLDILINSLTKSEKRYFKLQSELQSGKKDYLVLFELIEQGIPAEEIQDKFTKELKDASYEVTSKYLFKKVLNFLVYLRMDKDKEADFFFNLLKADILFEKTLYKESIVLLNKVEKDAKLHELYLHEIFAIKKELYFLDILNYDNVKEQDIVQKHLKISQGLANVRNIDLHSSLYELLKHQLIHKGHARCEEDKEDLGHLVVQELNLLSNPIANTFESQKLHLLFQANYFISINLYKSAGKIFNELSDLLHKYEYLWIYSPIYYLSMIEGVLKTLLFIKQYDEILIYLNKLQDTKAKTLHTEILISRILFIYHVSLLIQKGELKDALLLMDDYGPTLFQKLHLLDLDKQAEIYLYAAVIHLYNKDFDKSRFFLNKVLQDNVLYNNLPIFQTFRLIRLLLYYELGQFDILPYEIRSIKRKYKTTNTVNYILEKIVFKFISTNPLPAGRAQRQLLWKQINDNLKKIKSGKFEMQVLNFFDFESWIESKLLKVPIEESIKNKLNY
jgi:hypothetical protein